MRILITGAAGFIGQQLLADLAVQQPNWALFAGGGVPALLLEVAFGNLFLGLPFRLDGLMRSS